MNRLLTPVEVGELVGLKRDAIYRAIEAGELKAVRLRGRLRSREEWVAEWVEGSLVQPRRPPSDSAVEVRRIGGRIKAGSVRAQLREDRST